jgi:aspartate racemase
MKSTETSPRPEWKRVIGILGGLGPHAHIEFEILLLSATEKTLGRQLADQDYPPWVLSSMPTTPDRTTALLDQTQSPVDALVRSAERVSAADFAVIPCNTAHAFLAEVRERTDLPFLDMIQATAEQVVEDVGPRGTVGILAASGTLKSGLYADRVRALAPGVRLISPLDLGGGAELQRRLVMEPIFGEQGIKAGAFRNPERREQLAEPMREAARRLADAGAQVVLTACTEIPLVVGRDAVDAIPLLDPMAVAAERAIAIALGRRRLPGEPS